MGKARAFMHSVLILSALFVSGLAGAAPPAPRYDYAEMFDLTRKVMVRKPARDLLNSLFAEQLLVNPDLAAQYGFVGDKIKGFTETQMMVLLQEAPEIRGEIREYLQQVPNATPSLTEGPEIEALRTKWRERFTKLFQDKKLLLKFTKKNSPLEPFVMTLPPGRVGYGRVKTYITHPIREGKTVRPADDVEAAVVAFIKSAKKEIRFNVFDFDLNSIADAFIEAHRSGKDVMGGIDMGVIAARPEVKAIYDKLTAAGVRVRAVDSVGLNHQKLIATDWSLPEARVLMSEGNFTQSCLSPDGDLTGTGFRSADAVPNANMVNIIDSPELSLVVHHELTKTIDPSFALRGKEYPISGAYKVVGQPGEGGKVRDLIIAFTPNGGLEDINQNFISRAIKFRPGPKYLAQFAFASAEVEAALLADVIAGKAAGLPVNFHLIGDTPFAMQKWSVFLSIAGYRLEGEGDAKRYAKIPDAENKWLQALGTDEYARLQDQVRIAPEVYGTRSVKTAKGPVKVSAKIHHKLGVFGEVGNQVGIFGSFNFSQGAESNQEYIVSIIDDEVNAKMQAIVEWLEAGSPRSVVQETERRNKFRDFVPDEGVQVDAVRPGKVVQTLKSKCGDLMKPAAAVR